MLMVVVGAGRHVMVVGANAMDAKATLEHFIQQIGIRISKDDAYVGKGGFTDFIINQEGRDFFKA